MIHADADQFPQIPDKDLRLALARHLVEHESAVAKLYRDAAAIRERIEWLDGRDRALEIHLIIELRQVKRGIADLMIGRFDLLALCRGTAISITEFPVEPGAAAFDDPPPSPDQED